MRQQLPLVLSVTALVVALLGTTPLGEAAKRAAFPRNSVGPAQLKPRAVKTRHLGNGAVTTRQLRNGSVVGAKVRLGTLLARHFRPGQLVAGAPGPQGTRGPQGPRGEEGARGEQGPVGPTIGAVEVVGSTGLGPNPKKIGDTTEIRVETPGNLFIFGRIEIQVLCKPEGGCGRTGTLFLNGKSLSETGVSIGAPAGATSDSENFSTFTMVPVARGVHTLEWRFTTGGEIKESRNAHITAGAILLGGDSGAKTTRPTLPTRPITPPAKAAP